MKPAPLPFWPPQTPASLISLRVVIHTPHLTVPYHISPRRGEQRPGTAEQSVLLNYALFLWLFAALGNRTIPNKTQSKESRWKKEKHRAGR